MGPAGGSRRRRSAAGRGTSSGLQDDLQAVGVAVLGGDVDGGEAPVPRHVRVALGLAQLSDMIRSLDLLLNSTDMTPHARRGHHHLSTWLWILRPCHQSLRSCQSIRVLLVWGWLLGLCTSASRFGRNLSFLGRWGVFQTLPPRQKNT